MTKRTILGFCLLLTTLVGLLTWVAFQPSAARPNVKVVFTAYTNDVVGTRLAMFTLSNASPSAVRRLSYYLIQVPTSTRRTNIARGNFRNGTSVLLPGAAETVTVVAPTNQASWRPSVFVSPDVDVVRDMMDSVIVALRSLGFPTRYRKATYNAFSDWVSE